MEHLERWLREGNDLSRYLSRLMLGILGGFFAIYYGAIAFFGSNAMTSGQVDFAGWAILAIVLYSVMLLRKPSRRDAHRWSYASYQGRLVNVLGEHAWKLEQAAESREAIRFLVKNAPLPVALRYRLLREADVKMARAFELTVGLPAEQGLSRAAARSQVEGDIRWLGETYRGLERLANSPSQEEEPLEDPLAQLRTLVAEREEALAELHG
ncbi:hypothetical protein BH11ARM2_BH11ARM2_23980 [soil metagenome]